MVLRALEWALAPVLLSSIFCLSISGACVVMRTIAVAQCCIQMTYFIGWPQSIRAMLAIFMSNRSCKELPVHKQVEVLDLRKEKNMLGLLIPVTK